LPTALNWYLTAAGKNNPAALRKLGMLFEAGRGVRKNPATAFSYFDRAGAAGDEPAMRRLAAIFGAGEMGQPANSELAQQWRERADRALAAVNGATAIR